MTAIAHPLDDYLTESRKAVRVACDRCHGTRRQVSEWDCETGAATAFQICHSCLGSGHVLVTPPLEAYAERL